MKCAKCGQELTEGVSFCPYCGERAAAQIQGVENPIYEADVKGLLKSGKLAVYHDRAEFVISSVQKTVFNYSALIAVKKGLDRIIFITEDGQTESCTVNRKNIHEAFLYIDKASRPYIAERKNALWAKGIRYSLVCTGLAGGILNILDDRAEFKAKSGQCEVLSYKDVKSVSLSMGALEFSLISGKIKSFALDKEIRDEVFSFVEKAVAPYIAERKEALLARGISYSCPSSQGSDIGTLDILDDRAEYTSRSGQKQIVSFKDVRAVRLSMEMLELSLTDGTSKSFVVDRDICSEVLAFVENAIRPYVRKRTEGFETSFGIDERIEINESRGVFHIIRQNGNEITEEYPIGEVIKCERTECSTPGSVLGGVLSGGMAILGSAAKTANAPKADEKISSVDILLTVRSDQGIRTENVRFGNFLLGMSRTNPKYERYDAEASKLMDYLAGRCPECELIVPILPEPEDKPAEITVDTSVEEEEVFSPPDTTAEKDQFGIIKYVEGVSGFISECATPMTIAILGSWGSGRNSILKMLSASLEECYRKNLIWFNAWQFSQSDRDRQLSMQIGNKLISQLSGAAAAGTKDRAIKAAKGIINITSGFISQGSTDGQNLIGALFRENPADSPEKLVKGFSDLVKKRAAASNGKLIIFIDELDRLTPAKAVELLEAMRGFFDCEGCVFVVSADYNSVIRGATEIYGQDFDENKGKSFFDKIFQVSFRVPASGFNIQNYVKDKLAQIDIYPDDEAELGFYVELIRHSVGIEPKSMDHLFNSFLLLKKLADEETYKDKDRRLMLFSLLCMQTKFHEIYDAIVRMKDKLTPDFLADLSGEQSEILNNSRLSDDEKAGFNHFARIFCSIINTDKDESISQSECMAFAEVLDISSITSK